MLDVELTEVFRCAHRLGEEKVVVLGLNSEVFEDGVGPESFHVVLEGQSEYPMISRGIIPSFLFAHVGWDNEDHSLIR